MLHKYPAHNSLLPFYLAWQVDSKGSQYNVNFSYQLPDKAAIDCLIENLQKLIALKPYLRQTFHLENSRLMASIYDHLPAQVKFFTSTTADFDSLEKQLINEPHNLDTHSAIKLNIIHLTDCNHYVALFNVHHIIMDGPTLDRFMVDLNRLIADETIAPQTAEGYICRVAQESSLQEENIGTAMPDYMSEINNITHQINFPAVTKKTVWYYTDILPDAVMQKLTSCSRRYDISTYNLLLLAWEIFTAKLFNQNLALVKYPVNIRTDKSIDGCFLNTVIAPLTLTRQDTYLSLLNSWQDKIITFKRAAKILFSNQLEVGLIPNFTNAGVANDVLVIKGKPYSPKNFAQIAHANLNIRYRQQAGKCYFTCDIYAELFPEYVSASLLSRFFNYLDKLLSDPSAPLSHFDLTFTEERQTILYTFNETQISSPKDHTLVDLFEEQARKTPDNIAVVFKQTQLTYAQLNEQANQLAHYLCHHCQIKPDDLIALILDRTEYLLIGILGVLKSGAAYVPIDPSYPSERINYILKDTKAKIVVLNEMHRSKLNQKSHDFLLKREFLLENRRVIALDNPETRLSLTKHIQTNPVKRNNHRNLAYVIYTSGTTGYPKGVMIEHQSCVDFILNFSKKYFNDQKTISTLSTTNYVFDIFGLEYLLPLLSGGAVELLEVFENTHRRPEIDLSKYDFLQLTPSKVDPFLHVYTLVGNKQREPKLLKLLIGGEVLTKKVIEQIRSQEKLINVKFEIINLYGPTETTIWSLGKTINQYEINIGTPLLNEQAYVLDDNQCLLPIGMIGELHIGGMGVARGYQNELTSEKFIPNPFQASQRLYKTGDLVRWLPDGNLEFIGRKDFQVKIRGYRIELGEIEAKLTEHPEIDRAVVAEKHSDSLNKYLVAYYESTKKMDESKLSDYLATHLPEYMIPSVFIHIKKWPLTINGKLDRNALANPSFIDNHNYVPPNNEQEQLICLAFAKVLGLKKVGIKDDFFRLGGSSIKAITLVINLQNNFNINITDIFNFKTPENIAKNVITQKNSLLQHFEKIKLEYRNKKNNDIIDRTLQDKRQKYIASIGQLPVHYHQKSLTNILLTGATGFLGCNLLNQLLTLTNYNIFLLVRSPSKNEAFDRLNKKFQFYFDRKLDQFRETRLFVLAADLEKQNLDLSEIDYQMLTKKIDSIIHSAALIKHYGEYDKFYNANVQATINLLELCKLTQLKDFHYISTLSVLDQGYIPNYDQYVFTEDDTANTLEGRSNLYVTSKYQGEQATIHYRRHGVSSNIYRVGNLAYIANNNRIQENIDENGFFNRLKCLLMLGIIPEEINLEQMSAVDLTAQAIIKLFDKQELHNQIYHVFNPTFCNLAKSLSQTNSAPIQLVSMERFIDTIINLLNNPAYQKIIEKYLLHQGWLNESHTQSTIIRILQDRTHAVLQQLGFHWEPIGHEIFRKYTETELESAATV